MFYKIISSKKKEKISIKQSNGVNKKLLPKMRDADDISIMDRFNNAKVVNNLRRGFKFMAEKAKPKTDIATETDDPEKKEGVVEELVHTSHVAFSVDLLDSKENRTIRSISNASTVTPIHRIVESNYDVSNFHFTYDYNNGTGELYMRVGIAIFSVCALIDRCLNLVQMLEVYINEADALKDCSTGFIINTFSVVTSILFIFLQSFFIFKVKNL